MSEFLRVAEIVLAKYRQPMTARQIVNAAIEDKLFSDKRAGATPHQTMKSKLSVHIRRKGQNSTFVRSRPGRFLLRSLLADNATPYEAKPWKALPPAENVLVFPSAWLDQVGRFQGIRRNWSRLLGRLLRGSICMHVPRMEAEQNENCKQILTYVLVTRGSHILAFNRGKYNRVEDYLRGSTSIGFGGHVAEVDRTLYNLTSDLGLTDNAKRELFEELDLPKTDRQKILTGRGLKIVGLLNDDSSATGRKHFAVIFNYRASSDRDWTPPKRGEKSVTQLRWLDLNSSDIDLRQFEYWSQLCLAEFFPTSIRAQPSFLIRRRAPLVPPHLLCVVGTLGSGKSVATQVLKREFGYIEINSGRELARLLGIQPVPQTDRRVFQTKAWDFIQQPGGPTMLAQALWEAAEASGSEKVLIDGIRQHSTFEELRKFAGTRRVALLYVHTPPDLAFRFYRARSEEAVSIHQFLSLCESPVEADVRRMIGMSDAVLYNWTGKPMYRETIRKLMRNLQRDTGSSGR